MPARAPITSVIIAAGFLTTSCLSPQAIADDADLPGWRAAEQWDATAEAAGEKGRPIAILLHAFPGPSDRTDETARAWATNPNFAHMLRVHARPRSKEPWLQAILAQVDSDYDYGPRLLIVDPKLRLIGFRNYKHRDAFEEVFPVAAAVFKKLPEVEAAIEEADAAAEAGDYDHALQLAAEAADDDLKMSQAVAELWTGKVADGATPLERGRFFPELTGYAERYEQQAEQRLAAATHAYEDLEYDRALSLLRPLAADRAGLDAGERARELVREVRAAQKQQRAEKRRARDE